MAVHKAATVYSECLFKAAISDLHKNNSFIHIKQKRYAENNNYDKTNNF